MPHLTILSRHAADYERLIGAAALPGLTIDIATDNPGTLAPAGIELLLSEPDLAAEVIERCERIQWLQSTWAGNTPLIQASRHDYTLTAARGIFSARIREYVFAYLLYFSRQIAALAEPAARAPRPGTPRWSPPVIGSLAGKTLGVLGAGSLGQALLAPARQFGLRIHGLNRRGSSDDDYDQVFTARDADAFAQSIDYLVCLLPDTPDTENFVDADFLANLRPHVVLINAGRGNSIDDEALLGALDRGDLNAAVLDVFREEPLPDQHAFWSHPRVWVTQHTAAFSEPAAVAKLFGENYLRWRRGEALQYVIDFARGY